MGPTVYLFCKGNVTAIPPVYNLALGLADLEISVELVCGEISPETELYLNSKFSTIKIVNFNLAGKSNVEKIVNFRRCVNQKYNGMQNGIVWYATFDTAVALYNTSLYKCNSFNLSVLELYDSASAYIKFFLRIILHDAKNIITVEENRAAIMRVWYKLNTTPFVLPNKPFEISSLETNALIDNKISMLKEFAGVRKIVLYQGLIASDRNLDGLAKAMKLFNGEFIFALMGTDFSYYETLQALNDDTNIIYVGNLSAPLHLHITEIADIGILKYDYVDLNNIYCAPNKIWEYTSFNNVLLGNKIPGLNMIETYEAGVQTNFDSVEDIISGLNNIKENFAIYKKGSEKLFNSVNSAERIVAILESSFPTINERPK